MGVSPVTVSSPVQAASLLTVAQGRSVSRQPTAAAPTGDRRPACGEKTSQEEALVQMASQERLPYPFKLIPCDDETEKKIARDFLGYPSGLLRANHWGYKLSATVTEEEMEDAYNYPLDPTDIWVVTPPKCGTTWCQEMVWILANDLDYEGAKTPLMPDR